MISIENTTIHSWIATTIITTKHSLIRKTPIRRTNLKNKILINFHIWILTPKFKSEKEKKMQLEYSRQNSNLKNKEFPDLNFPAKIRIWIKNLSNLHRYFQFSRQKLLKVNVIWKWNSDLNFRAKNVQFYLHLYSLFGMAKLE